MSALGGGRVEFLHGALRSASAMDFVKFQQQIVELRWVGKNWHLIDF